MDKDKITTMLGMAVGALLAVKEYIVTSGDVTGIQFWMGLAIAAGTALWGYFTNKR